MTVKVQISEPFPEPTNWRCFDELSEEERDFFTGEDYLPLSPNHAKRIKLLGREDVKRIWEWMPFKSIDYWPKNKTRFTNEEHIMLEWNREEEPVVRDWLWRRGVPFGREIFILHDDQRTIVQTEWKILVRYWDAFSWSVGVEALVFDRSLTWCCHLHHEDVLIFESYNKSK